MALLLFYESALVPGYDHSQLCVSNTRTFIHVKKAKTFHPIDWFE